MTAKESKIQELIPNLMRDLRNDAQDALHNTEHQVSSFFNRLADKGSISQAEARQLAGEAAKRFQKNREDMSRYFQQKVGKAVSVLPVPSRDEIDDLHRRIDQLRQRVDRLAVRLER